MQQNRSDSTKELNRANRDRGLALSFYLMIMMVIACFSLIAICWRASQFGGYGSIAMTTSILPLVMIGFIIATWNWKKWGYYGLILSYLVAALLALISGAFLSLIPIIVTLILLVSLVQKQLELFD